MSSFFELVEKHILFKFRKKQSISNFIVKFIFDLTGDPDWKALEKFGLRLWMESARYSPYSDARVRDSGRLIAAAVGKDTSIIEREKYIKLSRSVWKNIYRDAGMYKFDRANYFFHMDVDVVGELEFVDFYSMDSDALEAFILGMMIRTELGERRRQVDNFSKRFFSDAMHHYIKSNFTSTASFIKIWAEGNATLFNKDQNYLPMRNYITKSSDVNDEDEVDLINVGDTGIIPSSTPR